MRVKTQSINTRFPLGTGVFARTHHVQQKVALIRLFLGAFGFGEILVLAVDVSGLQIIDFVIIFSWHKWRRLAPIFDRFVSREGRIHIFVDHEQYGQYVLVDRLLNQVDELLLHLFQRLQQIDQRIVLLQVLLGLALVDDFICKVDVALQQIHLLHDLPVLGRQVVNALLGGLRLGVAGTLLNDLLGRTWSGCLLRCLALSGLLSRELYALLLERLVHIEKQWQDIALPFELFAPRLDEGQCFVLDLWQKVLLVKQKHHAVHELLCADLHVEGIATLLHGQFDYHERHENNFRVLVR